MKITIPPIIDYVGDGITKRYAFPFDYLRRAYVKVSVDEETYEDFEVEGKVVVLAEPPAKDSNVRIYRDTPTTRLVSWADASVLKAKDMDIQQVQQLHIMEEERLWIQNNSVVLDENNRWDMHNHRITNVGNPIEPTDGVNKEYMETVGNGFIQQFNIIKGEMNTMLSNATTQAANSKTEAERARTYADTAKTSETNALSSENKAKLSETNAATSEANALRYSQGIQDTYNLCVEEVGKALKYTSLASTSATRAENYKNDAKTYETNARNSATAAKTSETNAKTSETHALTSETNALTSANKAKLSEDSARTSMSTASEKAAIATTKAEEASTSETNAKASELLAKQYRDEAEAFAPQGYNNLISKVDSNERRISALYDLGEGKTHRFETSTDEAYTKVIPSGAKCFDLKMLGGKSMVVNQLINSESITVPTTQTSRVYLSPTNTTAPIKKDHKYIALITQDKALTSCTYNTLFFEVGSTRVYENNRANVNLNSGKRSWVFTSNLDNAKFGYWCHSLSNSVVLSDIQLFDLTVMGLADSVNSLADFEKIFTEYIPYTEPTLVNHKVTDVVVRGKNGEVVETKQVPQAILDIEGYGWSAGSVYNYIDLERKKFVKCGDRVDMGTLTYHFDSSRPDILVCDTNLPPIKTVNWNEQANLLCANFVTKTQTDVVNKIQDKIIGVYNNKLYIYDSAYTDASAFKSAMSGVYLYYELSEPQEIDIDLDNRFSAILCEGNGSITFKNTLGSDYKVPIPNTEDFTIKLSEVVQNV